MADFSIDYRWESALHETPEVRETSAMLKIALAHQVVTRNEDIWSRTVRDEVRLSAYPLALWFAASWWRLRWEPLPASLPSHSWRMTHELAAAGHGYIWPRMLFASDGEITQIWSVQSKPDSAAAVRYLANATQTLSSSEFERVIDEFINGVLARLDAVGIQNTTLHDLWCEVAAERRDEEIAAYRRLEAMLGFDPDECPEDLHSQLSELIPQAGSNAVAEIAPVCASDQPEKKLREIIEFIETEGLEGQVDIPVQDVSDEAVPWKRGRNLAQKIHTLTGLEEGFVSNKKLSELMGLSEEKAFDAASHSRPPLGMSVRHDGSKRSKVLLSKSRYHSRRFELARHLGAHLIADRGDKWLPVTHLKTAHQKTQRAFAAEFLCPIHALKEYLRDLSMEAIAEASEHFCVSPKVVELQLQNNGILAKNEYGFFDFPYAANLKSDFSSPKAIYSGIMQ
ncbi:ImmA/IrrE family metallo-endopeptidase [Methylomagnum sp.]